MTAETMQRVETKACELCGGEFSRRRSASESLVQFGRRRFCSRRCAGAAMAATRQAIVDGNAAERIEDLQFLDSYRVGAAEAVRRAGFPTRDALEKFCERHGIGDMFRRMKHRDHVCKPSQCPEVT